MQCSTQKANEWHHLTRSFSRPCMHCVQANDVFYVHLVNNLCYRLSVCLCSQNDLCALLHTAISTALRCSEDQTPLPAVTKLLKGILRTAEAKGLNVLCKPTTNVKTHCHCTCFNNATFGTTHDRLYVINQLLRRTVDRLTVEEAARQTVPCQ
jgi:hypothetical protein